MVIIFVSFGMRKFMPPIGRASRSSSPTAAHLLAPGVRLRGEAHALGVTEFAIAALLIAGAFIWPLSALGAFMAS